MQKFSERISQFVLRRDLAVRCCKMLYGADGRARVYKCNVRVQHCRVFLVFARMRLIAVDKNALFHRAVCVGDIKAWVKNMTFHWL